MARVCTGCGLTTNDDGDLIVNTSGVANDNPKAPITTSCVVSSGTHIYCDETTGGLYGEPEKFYRKRRFGKNLTPDMPIDLTSFAPADDNKHNVGAPIVIGFSNPSNCRPMNFLIESGISHARLDHDGAGVMEVEVGTTLTISGDATLAAADTGHQIWASGTGVVTNTFDSMGARAYSSPIVIPPGGNITILLQGWMRVTSAGGNSDIQNFTIDLVYDAWND